MGAAVEQILAGKKIRSRLQSRLQSRFIPYLFVGKKNSDLFAISVQSLKNIEPELLADVDVWIDFTSGGGLTELIKVSEKFKTPIVSGSTGLAPADIIRMKKSSQKRKIFWASNMSPGLWAFRQAMKALSNIANFDFALEEIHHTQKKDQPSGTAKTLRLDLEKIINKKIKNPTSLRLGGVFGVHTLYAASANEVITMQHQALSRKVFAEGALRACDWLVQQPTGFYSMDDMFLKSKRTQRRSR